MTRAVWVVVALAAVLLVGGHAYAGGSLSAGPVEVVVLDRLASCDAPIAGFCLVEANVSSAQPGDWTANAHQRVDYVGIAVDGSAADAPAQSATVDLGNLQADHPIFTLFTAAWNAADDSVPLPEGYGLVSTRDNITLWYVGPSVHDLSHPIAPRAWTWEHSDWLLGYDHAGPFFKQGSGDTDYELAGLAEACALGALPECASTMLMALQLVAEATPNVRYGFEVHDVEVASDPDSLDRPTGPEREPAPLARAQAAPPAPPAWTNRGPAPVRDEAGPAPGVAVPGSSSSADPLVAPPATPPLRLSTSSGSAPSSPLLAAAATALASAIVLLAAVLYTRLTRATVVDQDARRDILRIITERPGIRLVDLVATVGMGRTAVGYHVRVLARAGLVDVVARGTRKCLVPKGAPSGGVVLTGLKLDGHPARSRLLGAVRAAPDGLPRRDAHALLADVPLRTRNHTIRLLVRHGLLREERGLDGEARLLAA